MKSPLIILASLIIGLGFSSCTYVTDSFKLSAAKEKIKKQRKAMPVESEIIPASLTGTMLELGGALISPTKVVHCTHWAIEDGRQVYFQRNDGGRSMRIVIDKHNLGSDVSVLTLNEPLDLEQHTFYDLAYPEFTAPTTVYRFRDREVKGRRFAGTNMLGYEHVKLHNHKDGVGTGDSGKIWVQKQNGKVVIVSFTSFADISGPDLRKRLETQYESKTVNGRLFWSEIGSKADRPEIKVLW